MHIRKIHMHRTRLSSGRVLLLEEQEAKEVGDQLVERALISPTNQRRLAFGDVALEGPHHTASRPLSAARRERGGQD